MHQLAGQAVGVIDYYGVHYLLPDVFSQFIKGWPIQNCATDTLIHEFADYIKAMLSGELTHCLYL
jgi:hypothetical protein